MRPFCTCWSANMRMCREVFEDSQRTMLDKVMDKTEVRGHLPDGLREKAFFWVSLCWTVNELILVFVFLVNHLINKGEFRIYKKLSLFLCLSTYCISLLGFDICRYMYKHTQSHIHINRRRPRAAWLMNVL